MFIVIICALLVLIGIALLIFGPARDGVDEIPFKMIGMAFIVLAVIVFLLCSWTQVGAKNVGVLTTGGKVSERTLSPGYHATWPWQRTTEIDGGIQSREYEGEDCIYVKIGDGSRSCVTTTINWRIIPDAADTIYNDFRDPGEDYDDDPVQAYWGKVLSKQFKAAIQSAFADYNPVAELKAVGGAEAAGDVSFSPDLPKYEDALWDEMQERLGEEPVAEIDTITISYFSFSESTQNIIDDFVEEVGVTRVTAQGKETAREQKEINELLAESVSDPNVLVAKCLNLIEAGAFDPPAGFSCWPGGGEGSLTFQ